MKRFDWRTADTAAFPGMPDGYGAAHADIADAVGAQHLAGGLYELAPGQKLAPYHWESSQEEWLVVLSGRPSVRAPDETRELRAGDVVAFVRGPAGAHQILNASEEPARLIMLSERSATNVIRYPDSDKVGVRAAGVRSNFRAGDAVGYWEGEAQ